MGWSYVSWLAKIMSPCCLGGVTRQESGDWVLLGARDGSEGRLGLAMPEDGVGSQPLGRRWGIMEWGIC